MKKNLTSVRKSDLPIMVHKRPKTPCEAAAAATRMFADQDFTFVAMRQGGKRRCRGCQFHKNCSLKQTKNP